MLKYVFCGLLLLLIFSASIYIVMAHCEQPPVLGITFSQFPKEELCDASMGISTANLEGNLKAYVVSGSVDHYKSESYYFLDSGFYSMTAIARIPRLVDMVQQDIVARDDKADYYIGGCAETVSARIIYDNPELKKRMAGEGEVDIWGTQSNHPDDEIVHIYYDHDDDKLGLPTA